MSFYDEVEEEQDPPARSPGQLSSEMGKKNDLMTVRKSQLTEVIAPFGVKFVLRLVNSKDGLMREKTIEGAEADLRQRALSAA